MGVSRRAFVGGGLFAGVAAIFSFRGLGAPDLGPTQLEYRGYALMWRDWVRASNTDEMFGHWLARSIVTDSKRQLAYYSTHGGIVDRYYPGSVLNLSIQQGFKPITEESSQEEKDTAKRAALDHLKLKIDQVIASRAMEAPEPKYEFGFTGWQSR